MTRWESGKIEASLTGNAYLQNNIKCTLFELVD